MNTALAIIEAIRAAQPDAFTLSGGYMVNKGSRTLFETARIISERRNSSGRVLMCVAQYKDGSRIRFTWSDGQGSRVVDDTPKGKQA